MKRSHRTASPFLLAILAAACSSAPAPQPPQPANLVEAEVLSEPNGVEVGLRGKAVGTAPVHLRLASLDEAIEIAALADTPPTMERRLRILGPDRVQVLLRVGGEPSPLARALGLTQVIVFDYGEATSFDVNSHDLKADFVPLLARQAELLAGPFAGLQAYICGHTDASGEDDFNQVLSLRRAEAVSGWLVDHGIDRARLVTQGFGAGYPLDSNATAAGRARNRRTEIVLPD